MILGDAARRAPHDLCAVGGFASRADHAECTRIHRMYGTTYYFASRAFKPATRRRVDALYAFVRVPDEWLDHPAGRTVTETSELLLGWRRALLNGLDGVRPEHPVVRAFCDVIRECDIPVEDPLAFLDAMEMDLTISRYPSYAQLRRYMRGSACAVGTMMCQILGAPRDPAVLEAASALGEAMQLTNFLRDVSEDAALGRIYLPQEDLQEFGIGEAEILRGRMSQRFAALMRFEIIRARKLYEVADTGIGLLPKESQAAVKLARILYARILDRIEAQSYDVFASRARTTRLEKLSVALQVICGLAR